MDPGVSGIRRANQRLMTIAEPRLNSRSGKKKTPSWAKKTKIVAIKLKWFDSHLICMDVEHCNHSSSWRFQRRSSKFTLNKNMLHNKFTSF